MPVRNAETPEQFQEIGEAAKLVFAFRSLMRMNTTNTCHPSINGKKAVILHAAAENGNLPFLKVGGEADVVQGISLALAEVGHRVIVCAPSPLPAEELPEAKHIGTIRFSFGGRIESADAYLVRGTRGHPNLQEILLCHPAFVHPVPGKGYTVYTDDPADQPFATDAAKFAEFSAAVAAGVESGFFGHVDRIHVHDWHLGNLLVIRRYDPSCNRLRATPCVMTIHNAAIQGRRPFTGAASSFTAWYPQLLNGNRTALADPTLPHCYNPMAAGIRHADKIHLVSPGYVEEVLRPSDPSRGFYGGEGLEADLREAQARDKLVGILNGCDYAAARTAPPASFAELVSFLQALVVAWAGRHEVVPSRHFLAHARLAEVAASPQPPDVLLTSVGRLTDQKCLLMKQPLRDGRPALWNILDALREASGLLFLLGTGDAHYEAFFKQTTLAHQNFIFLNGFSSEAATALYSCGSMFLMPSSFEPCGIAQMLAMARRQPCVVHGVGGLKDTVKDMETGFVFTGATPQDQAENFVSTVNKALQMQRADPVAWENIRKRAAAQRFLWAKAADEYVNRLYQLPG